MLGILESEIQKIDDSLQDAYNQKKFKKFVELIESGLHTSSDFKKAISQLSNEDVQGCSCDNDLAQQLIEQGKVEYQSKNYQLAARKYSDSLIAGSVEDVDQLSKAYSNRGLCRIKMQQQQQSFNDFLCAINLNPTNDKAWFQLAVLLDIQGNYNGAKQAIQKCLNIQRQNSEKIDKRVDELHSKLCQLDSSNIQQQNHIQSLNENMAYKGVESSFSSMVNIQNYVKQRSPQLTLKQEDGKGRLLVAHQHVSAATDVIHEMPVVAVLYKQQRKEKCWYCFGDVGQYFHPCLNCCVAFYCSPECRHKDFAAHRQITPLECGTPFCALLSESTLLATRLAILQIQKKSFIVDVLEDQIQNQSFEDLRLQTIQATLAANAVKELLGKNVAKLQNSQLQQQIGDDQILSNDIKIKKQGGNVQQFQSKECRNTTANIVNQQRESNEFQLQQNRTELTEQSQFDLEVYYRCSTSNLEYLNSIIRQNDSIFSYLILQNQLRIGINGIAITPNRLSSSRERIGLGVFPVSSFFNHTCCPNLQLRFEGRKLIGRVVRGVVQGQEVGISYGPQVGAQNTKNRRYQLMEQYHFHCICEGCTDKQVQAIEKMNASFLCRQQGCRGLIDVNEPKPCSSCGYLLSIEQMKETKQQYMRSSKLEQQADKILRKGKTTDIQEIYDVYKQSYMLKSTILLPQYSNELGFSTVKLRDVCTELGRYKEAVQLGKKVVQIVECNYGKNTPQVAFEKKELYNLMAKGFEQSEEMISLKKEIDDILFLYFGFKAD